MFPSEALAPREHRVHGCLEIWYFKFDSISHSFAATNREILSRTLEEEFYISARPCIILYVNLSMSKPLSFLIYSKLIWTKVSSLLCSLSEFNHAVLGLDTLA